MQFNDERQNKRLGEGGGGGALEGSTQISLLFFIRRSDRSILVIRLFISEAPDVHAIIQYISLEIRLLVNNAPKRLIALDCNFSF